MTFEKLSTRQKQVFRWCYGNRYKAIICDGAVRSGKTVCMTASFILWAMKEFDGAIFGICGKTVRSAERNIVVPLTSIVDITAYFRVSYSRSVNLLTVEGDGHKNSFYVFGGKDESSYMLIQGITLSGVLFDEVALMPRSFVEQAITRTLSVSGAKLWFNCNPESPLHWFYTEWVCRAEERNALHLHFLMSDNPILSREQLDAADKMFTGVFHDRYIKGLWTNAEGVIYRTFADDPGRFIISDLKNFNITFATIGVDFGGGTSAHAFNCTAFSRGLKEVITVHDYHRKDAASPEELYNDFGKFLTECRLILNGVPIVDVYCDSAEQTLIGGLRAAGVKNKWRVEFHNARKKPIIDRIRFYSIIQDAGRYFILKNCKPTIDAFCQALWDKKDDTARLDDGTTNIDNLDAQEYSSEPYMNYIIKAGVRI